MAKKIDINGEIYEAVKEIKTDHCSGCIFWDGNMDCVHGLKMTRRCLNDKTIFVKQDLIKSK